MVFLKYFKIFTIFIIILFIFSGCLLYSEISFLEAEGWPFEFTPNKLIRYVFNGKPETRYYGDWICGENKLRFYTPPIFQEGYFDYLYGYYYGFEFSWPQVENNYDPYNWFFSTLISRNKKNIIIKIGSSNTWQYDIYNGMEFTFCTDYKLSENNTNLTILDGDIPGLTYPSTWILQKN